MKISATYIGPVDATGFVPNKKYTLNVGINNFTKQTRITSDNENIRAKYSSVLAFLLNFDEISILIKKWKKNDFLYTTNRQ